MKFIQKIVDWSNDPNFLVKFHYYAMLVWLILLPPTLLLWPESILWLALMSLWANFAGHWAAAQAAHAEKSEQSGLDNEDLDKKLDRILYLLEQRKESLPEECL